MRDPARIVPFLAKLAEFWQERPDWRFGQVIMNLTRGPDHRFQDPWNWEDEKWIAKMQNYGDKDEANMTVEELEMVVRNHIDPDVQELLGDEAIRSIAELHYKELHGQL